MEDLSKLGALSPELPDHPAQERGRGFLPAQTVNLLPRLWGEGDAAGCDLGLRVQGFPACSLPGSSVRVLPGHAVDLVILILKPSRLVI